VAKSDTETPANVALASELRAEAAAQGMTHRQLAERSGIPYGNVVKTMSSARHTTVTEIQQFAVGLGLTPDVLIRRVVERMGGMPAVVDMTKRRMSEGVPNNVTALPRRVEDMSADELESQRHAATHDAEMDQPEQFD
jgi:hypothetical protein